MLIALKFHFIFLQLLHAKMWGVFQFTKKMFIAVVTDKHASPFTNIIFIIILTSISNLIYAYTGYT